MYVVAVWIAQCTVSVRSPFGAICLQGLICTLKLAWLGNLKAKNGKSCKPRTNVGAHLIFASYSSSDVGMSINSIHRTTCLKVNLLMFDKALGVTDCA